ncbi:MAG: 1-deoxy-D-xylulose-5-phosphate reductoisomerase, partial [Candidatus Peregrinibacteria bacterium]|nr:1-deoxy-D-xylulose-5-phosphate reductoisomerase [Candidatus Peregrinibacteria bacterium]
MKKRLIILGSTGSIGTQALEVIREQIDSFELVGLCANQNEALLNEQVREFRVSKMLLARGDSERVANWVEELDADLVLVAISGTAGLLPTLAAIRSGKNIALANKETLVMAGELVMAEVYE